MAAENEVHLHASEAESWRAAAEAIEEVLRIEDKYSRFRDDSIVSRINAAAGGEPVPLDPETHTLLAYADACYRQSGGLFDATSGVLRRAWRFDRAVLPDSRAIEDAVRLIGWDRVEWDADRVRLPVAGMELDFGGFGKEYAVDRAALKLREAGVASGLVNLAGDVAILAPQPDGSAWRVGIRHPRKPGELIATLPIYSGGLATSGDYERFIEVDGVRHSHILDPRTGQSARGFQSVTVHAPSCLVAGSAATIAMLMGRDAGLAWLRESGFAHFCVQEDGTVVDAFR